MTPWRNGKSRRRIDDAGSRARETRGCSTVCTTHRLPRRAPRWRPLVGQDLADDLATAPQTWDSGPYGEDARTAIREQLATSRTGPAATTSWPPPPTAAPGCRPTANPTPATSSTNPTPSCYRLGVLEAGTARARPPQPRRRRPPAAGRRRRMLDLFDLEWRLDEIAQYATWFEAWHTGTASDAVAFAGLVGELAREGRHTRNWSLRTSLRDGPWTPSGSRESAPKELDDEHGGDRALRQRPGGGRRPRTGQADPHPPPARDEGARREVRDAHRLRAVRRADLRRGRHRGAPGR